MSKLMTWKEMTIGGVTPWPGNTDENNTGSWRTYCPMTDFGKCIHCLRCWIMCPDSSVKVEEGKKTGTDMMYCKGCGICAQVCPVGAITMKLESEVGPDERKG